MNLSKQVGPVVKTEVVEGGARAQLFSNCTRDKVEAIQKAVEKYFGLKPRSLQATIRIKNISGPRQIAIYLIRQQTQMSLSDIGKIFGGKNHTTIMHAYRKIEAAVRAESKILEDVVALQMLMLH